MAAEEDGSLDELIEQAEALQDGRPLFTLAHVGRLGRGKYTVHDGKERKRTDDPLQRFTAIMIMNMRQ
ncbi:hypothetical protein ACROYT_G028694 [Oculina patagonica]